MKPATLARLFFFLSGAAALIYEIIWLKLLGLVFGNTTFAISTVLAAYMAGLGFGSFFIGRFADRGNRPLFLYGTLELAIGIYAAATLLILSLLDFVYVIFAQQFQPGLAGLTAVRFALSFLIVFVPTFFMGGTFPVLVKFFTGREKNASVQIASLYGINTLGAVLGTVLAGFLLLPQLGIRYTLAITVLLNVGIGLLSLWLSSRLETKGPAPISAESKSQTRPSLQPMDRQSRFLFAGIFVSGAAAMLYEIGWTRVLASVLGSSTYAFTIMLATFLLGIGLGSILSKYFLKRKEASWIHWGALQAMIALSALLTLPLFPWASIWFVHAFRLTLLHPWLLQLALFVICSALMLLPAIGFGALFPLSSSLYTRTFSNLGHHVGALYLGNTLGNIAGSVAAGFFFIPVFGIHKTIVLAIVAGIALFLAALFFEKKMGLAVRLSAAGLSAILLFFSFQQAAGGWDRNLITSGLYSRAQFQLENKTGMILNHIFNGAVLYYKEGLNSIVSVSRMADLHVLKVNGKPDASTGEDMRTQLLLGHIPHLLHPSPKKTLIIGFGSGTTLGTALAYPLQKIDCVELEPAVLEAAPFFEKINLGSYKNPRANRIINDGRNHLKVHDETYDIVISEPSNPWMAGVSNLFSVEFYKLVENRLSTDGIFCQWLQQYSIGPADFQMVIASVQSVFPHVTLWRGSPSDVMIIASKNKISFDWENAERKWAGIAKAQKNLLEPYEILEAGSFLSYFLLGENDTNRLILGALLNTDDRLRLEYSAPLSLYDDFKGEIDRLMTKNRTEFESILSPASMGVSRYPERMLQLGRGHMGMNEVPSAKKYFQGILFKSPGHENANIQMARCFIEESNHAAAVPILAKYQTPESYHYLALALSNLGKKEEAVQAIGQAVSLDNQNWRAFSSQGHILASAGKWPEAAAAYAAAAKMAPYRLTLDLSCANAYLEAGNLPEALAILKKLLQEYSPHYLINFQLQKTFVAIKDLGSAIAVNEAYTALNPYNLDCWNNLLKLYKAAGLLKKSYMAFKHVEKLSR